MLFIALVGAAPMIRQEIAQRLIEQGKAQLVAYEVPGFGRLPRRASVLREATGQALEMAIWGGMIITSAYTEDELAHVRAIGGQVWHVNGTQAGDGFLIRRGDALVSPIEGGEGAYRDVIDALHDLILAVGRRSLKQA